MILADADWPLFGWQTDVRPLLLEARQQQRSIVLGTLIDAEGSTPRPIGSQMVFDGESASGYFSGGCVEADVANHARLVAQGGAPRTLVYGHGSPWIDVRLLCGGSLRILLEHIDPDDAAVDNLLDLRERRVPARWSSDGRVRSVIAVSPKVRSMEVGRDRYWLDYAPPWRFVIVGGDPVSLALAQLAALSGFDTFLIRANGPTTGPPLTGVRYLRAQAPATIAALIPDRWTAIVSAMHDDGEDDAVLVAAFAGMPAYVGVLGAAGRVAARTERLLACGVPASQIASLHAPIGAVRSGKAPWEVAVSVVAEVMQTRTEQKEASIRHLADRSRLEQRSDAEATGMAA